jgi:hypothetical protein
LALAAACGNTDDEKTSQVRAAAGGSAGAYGGGATGDAALDLAQPEAAATRDARTLGDGPVVRTCVEALSTAINGQACATGATCNGYDACCNNTSYCDYGSHWATDWHCFPPVTTGCTSPPNASVAGTTPFGDVSFDHAWSSFSHAFAVNLEILFTNASPAATCAARRMGVWLKPFTSPSQIYVGVHDVPVTLFVDGQRHVAEAEIRITSMGPTDRVPSGTIEVAAWNLKGSFSAPECVDLDRSGP